MTVEFVDDYLEDSGEEPVDMLIDDIHLRGIIESEESGAGITEKYRSERDSESGSYDEVDEPPAPELKLTAWDDMTTYERVDALREREGPFPVDVGPFSFEQMGVKMCEGVVLADNRGAVEIAITLKEFRGKTVHREDIDTIAGGGTADAGYPTPPSADNPGTVGTPGSGGSSGSGGTGGGNTAGPIGPSTDGGQLQIEGLVEPGMTNSTTATANAHVSTLPEGAHETYHVGDNETFTNRLFDAEGGGVSIVAEGSDWTIQNIGISGAYHGRETAAGDALMALTAEGGQCTVDHVYAGDGAGGGGDTAIWLSPQSSTDASVSITDVNVQSWQDVALYLSEFPTRAELSVGPIYAYNNRGASIRASHGTFRDCVVYHDDEAFDVYDEDNRCLWLRPPGPVILEGGEYFSTAGQTAVIGNESTGRPARGVAKGATLEGILEGPSTDKLAFAAGAGREDAAINDYASTIPWSAADASEGWSPAEVTQ